MLKKQAMLEAPGQPDPREHAVLRAHKARKVFAEQPAQMAQPEHRDFRAFRVYKVYKE